MTAKSDGWRSLHSNGDITIFHRDGTGHDGQVLGAFPDEFRGLTQPQLRGLMDTLKNSIGEETFASLVSAAKGPELADLPAQE